jgi:hypothetical protein
MCLQYCIWAQNHTARLLHWLWKYGTLCWSWVLTMQSTTVFGQAESAAQCSYAESFLSWWDGSESDDSLKEFFSNIFRLQSCRLVWLKQWKQWRWRNRDITALEWKPLLVWLDLRYIAVYRLCPPSPLAIFMSYSADSALYRAFDCCGGK